MMTVCNIRGKNPKENFFRRSVELKKAPRRAIVRIFSDTGYELFLNGRLAVAVSEWANVRDYDLTPFFFAGKNQIAVRAMNMSGHRGFAFELAIGRKTVLVSDGSWKSFPEERWGWILPGFDDSKWPAAEIMDMSAAGGPQWWTSAGDVPRKIIPNLEGSPFFTGAIPKGVASPFYTGKREVWQPAPEVLETAGKEYADYAAQAWESLHPAAQILEKKADTGTLSEVNGAMVLTAPERYTGPSFVVDLGEECVGYFRMRLQSAGPVSFRLYHAETLTEAKEEISRDQLQNRMLREEYRLEGGMQEFEQRMRFGGRFLRVEFFDTPTEVRADGFSLRWSLYPVNRKGFFFCDDPVLNRLWMMSMKTVLCCMQEYYLDAPKRDRFLWVADARNQALFNYFLFGDATLFEYCWDEMAKCRYPDGSIPSAYGQGLSILWDYVAWYVIAFQDYYRYSGNAAFLLKHRDTIERAVDFLSTKAGTDLLIDIPANPLGKLWMVTVNNATGKDTQMNILYLRAVETAELTEQLAGAQMPRWRKFRETLAPAVKALAGAHPLEAFAPNWHCSAFIGEMLEDVVTKQGVPAGLQMLRSKWEVFTHGGFDTLREGMRNNADTEVCRYQPGRSGYGSFCHGWTAHPADFLPRRIAGITPLEPGWKKIRIAPELCDLKMLAAVVPTPQGEIAIRVENGNLKIAIPPGCSAEVLWNGKLENVEAGSSGFF